MNNITEISIQFAEGIGAGILGAFLAFIIGKLCFDTRSKRRLYVFVPRSLKSVVTPGTSNQPKEATRGTFSKTKCDLHKDCIATRTVRINKTEYQVCDAAEIDEIEKMHQEEMRIWATEN